MAELQSNLGEVTVTPATGGEHKVEVALVSLVQALAERKGVWDKRDDGRNRGIL
jgi:predicted Rdx family selenoprotein